VEGRGGNASQLCISLNICPRYLAIKREREREVRNNLVGLLYNYFRIIFKWRRKIGEKKAILWVKRMKLILRKFIVLVLIVTFVFSFIKSVQKFRLNRIGTDISDEKVSGFRYPGFDICAYNVKPPQNFSLVKMATHSFILQNRYSWNSQ